MSELHLVIGAGTVGGRLAELLTTSGKKVKVVTRSATGDRDSAIEYCSADATSVGELLNIASKAKVIYNCANPAYNKWDKEWPKLALAINEFALRVEADLVICSNLYGYGPYDGILTESLPLKATWVNGRVRAKAWEDAKALHDAGKLRVTEVRGSDYICANEQSRMGDRVVPRLMAGKNIQLLGAIDQPHTWTDPTDVAKLMMVLADSNESWGAPWHVPSNPPKTQIQVVQDIAQEIGIANPQVSSVPVAIEKFLGIFNPVMRELAHTDYQFNKPFIMSDEKSRKTFGLQPKNWEKIISDLVNSYRGKNEKH